MNPHPFSVFLRRTALVLLAASVGLVGKSLVDQPPIASRAEAASTVKPKDGYDLSSLDVFRKVVVFIKDNYVDPKRIDPKEMFLSALESVEKSTAEVLVEGNAKDGKVRVTCGSATKEFDFKDVESIWMIPHRMSKVFAFLQEHLSTATDRRDVEYSAINGMLTTLDPHSWLLKPDTYREMKLQTKGEFGGLGFVISMEEERLTVKKVLKNTPAFRAGIKKGDHIARIEDESTINMDLNEAVSKLRGKPGTEVRIYVKRDKEEEKLNRLVRDLISIESVTSQFLGDGVGYVRLSSFAGTTSRDLQAAIRELSKQNGGRLAGLVLDLRANPGGLLEQAIQVTDQFVEEGTIVTTAGMSDKLREPKSARRDGGEKDFPIAVLVNSESASASEIVAGALKNLNRAVIIGRQTFGKGSVQVLYDLPVSGGSKTGLFGIGDDERKSKDPEEAALKLTIAQYLTPGDQSIQEIGVTPDIELVPARVTKDRVDLFSPPRLVREADLEKHFANGFQPTVEAKKAAEAKEKPAETLRYLREEKAKKETAAKGAGGRDAHKDGDELDDDPAIDEPDEELIMSDAQVLFAKDLVRAAPKTERKAMLEAAKPFLAERRAAEEARIQKAIEALGIDWSETKKLAAGVISATATFSANPPKAVGGEPLNLTVTVQNTGKVPLERLRAWTKCDAERTQFQQFCSLLDRREFLFGKLNPGEKKSWSTQVKVPFHLPAVHEVLTLQFQEAHGNAPEPQKIEVDSVEAARPAFAFTYQIMDPDGLAQPGETVDVQVDVKNTGAGRSSKLTYVSLRNQQNDKIFMKKGRVSVGEMKPGETKSATLTLEVKPGLDVSGGIPLKLEIGDREMWEFTTGKINLPGLATAPVISTGFGLARVVGTAIVRAAPTPTAPILAELQKGASVPSSGSLPGYVKVEWMKGRSGFVATEDVQVDLVGKRELKTDAKIVPTMQLEPPVISLQNIDPTKGAVVVDGDRFRLSGVASDAAGLQDLRVFVDNEKVFFRAAMAGDEGVETGRGGRVAKLPFATEFPLKPGNNMVLVVAREDEEFASQRTLVIYRRPPSLAERKADDAVTPKAQ